MQRADFEFLLSVTGTVGGIIAIYMAWLSGRLNDRAKRVQLEIEVAHLKKEVEELTDRVEYLERKK